MIYQESWKQIIWKKRRIFFWKLKNSALKHGNLYRIFGKCMLTLLIQLRLFQSKSVFLSISFNYIVYNWFWIMNIWIWKLNLFFSNFKLFVGLFNNEYSYIWGIYIWEIYLYLLYLYLYYIYIIIFIFVKDLLRRFKKMQLKIYGLNLGLNNQMHNLKKRNLSKIHISIADHRRKNIYVKSLELKKKMWLILFSLSLF